MSKSVVFSMCSRLACASATSPAVVLCLNSDALLTSGRTTIDGVLTKVYRVQDTCGGCGTLWRYVISYDNTLLVDPTSALTSDEVTGIFCKGCLTTWVSEEIAAAIAALP